MGEPSCVFGAGTVGVVPRRAFGSDGIAGQNQPHDFFMLMPHQWALLGIVKDDAHGAFEVRPLRRDRILDRAISGQAVQRGVKGNVCLNKG